MNRLIVECRDCLHTPHVGQCPPWYHENAPICGCYRPTVQEWEALVRGLVMMVPHEHRESCLRCDAVALVGMTRMVTRDERPDVWKILEGGA